MLFNSYIFVLLFLPLNLCGYFALNRFGRYRLASAWILGMSLWFYGYFNVQYLPIILLSVVVNFLFYKLLQPNYAPKLRKGVLAAAVLLNVGILFYFKYYDFFLENCNYMFGTAFRLLHLLLPLGISFFTFQQLSFVIDSYKREVPKYDFLNYAVFVTYFPQLIAGPIVTHDELVPQFMDPGKRKFQWDNMAKGLQMLALGMAKKVLLADTFGNAVNWGFASIDALGSTDALIIMLAYSIQIYFDFSGYCDMAHGIAWMMNIELPDNFHSPYQAKNIVAFWDRWHMTLTRFFTRYIYIPLGGSRKGEARTYLNTMIVFLISGFWHGANWTFVLWGALHGLFNVLTKVFRKYVGSRDSWLGWLVTFLFVNVAFLFFRADSIGDGVRILKTLLQLNFAAPAPEILECFGLPEFMEPMKMILGWNNQQVQSMICLPGFFAAAYGLLLFAPNNSQVMKRFRPTVTGSILTAVLMVWCILSMAGVSTFLYFNF